MTVEADALRETGVPLLPAPAIRSVGAPTPADGAAMDQKTSGIEAKAGTHHPLTVLTRPVIVEGTQVTTLVPSIPASGAAVKVRVIIPTSS